MLLGPNITFFTMYKVNSVRFEIFAIDASLHYFIANE